MHKKIRQITDTVHGSIYISELESKMMSTPFFNRLNDIYQSSTVYFTFPSNRTKRYEHSLGTMDLASQMFSSAFANAETDVRYAFFEAIKGVFFAVIGRLNTSRNIADVDYLSRIANSLNLLIPLISEDTSPEAYWSENIHEAVRSGHMNQINVNHQNDCFLDILNADENLSLCDISVSNFLYQCVLESLRIAALFHDIGHPPYSHLIEECLSTLYKKCKADTEITEAEEKQYNPQKAAQLLQCLEPFISDDEATPIFLCKETCEAKNAQLHERVGIKMLQLAFESTLESIFAGLIAAGEVTVESEIKALYYVTVAEFTFSILLERHHVFKDLHRFIDGPIDSDRLDYVMRDSLNSGICWGKIPYKRIINSVKLAKIEQGSEQVFCLTFPRKLSDDLDDVIVGRYKVFSRINYHHRSVKTGELLSQAVYSLADNYLKTQSRQTAISNEISDLWKALGGAMGNQANERKIAKWNDSWLISVLNDALVALSDSAQFRKMTNGTSTPVNELKSVLYLLEEVLLNNKHYYSLIKRQADGLSLMEHVFLSAELSDEKIEALIQQEYTKMATKTNEAEVDEAREGLFRLQLLKNKIRRTADFNLLEDMFPSDKDGTDRYFVAAIIERILKRETEQEEKSRKISGYFIKENLARQKLGIPRDAYNPGSTIYLHDTAGNIYVYETGSTMWKQLEILRSAALWSFVYIKPNVAASEIPTILDEIIVKIADAIGEHLHSSLARLFPQSACSTIGKGG